jgi:hypothetical protein
MSTPSIKVGQGNWGIKAGNLLAYANTDKKYVAREFTVGRLLRHCYTGQRKWEH